MKVLKSAITPKTTVLPIPRVCTMAEASQYAYYFMSPAMQRIRKEKGISREQLAKRCSLLLSCDLSAEYIKQVEAKSSLVHVTEAAAIALILEVQPSVIVSKPQKTIPILL